MMNLPLCSDNQALLVLIEDDLNQNVQNDDPLKQLDIASNLNFFSSNSSSKRNGKLNTDIDSLLNNNFEIQVDSSQL